MKPLCKKTPAAGQANSQPANPAHYSATLQKALHLTRQALTPAAPHAPASWQRWLTKGQTKH